MLELTRLTTESSHQYLCFVAHMLNNSNLHYVYQIQFRYLRLKLNYKKKLN